MSNSGVSDEDRKRWDGRFADGAYADRPHPSDLVKAWAEPGPGRALDVAAGAGRNSAYLTELGYHVVAVDVSSVGLERARARTPGLETVTHDLDEGLPADLGVFDLIVVTRYLNLPLMADLIANLNPSGALIAEVLLAAAGGVGPAEARFRAPPGALAAACGPLTEKFAFEGEVVDPDGRTAHVAQFVGML